MKICLTHELFYPEIVGGGEILLKKTVEMLLSQGIEVHIITSSTSIQKKITIEKNRFKIIRIKVPHRYLLNFYSHTILKLISKISPDLIHTNTFNIALPSFYAAKSLKIPIILMVHGVYSITFPKMFGIKGFLFWKMEKFILERKYDIGIFLSDFSYNFARVSYQLPYECVIIKPGIPHRSFPSKVKDIDVLFVGRLSPQKGVEKVIEIAKRLPNFKFMIVGKGELESLLTKTIKKERLRNIVYKKYVNEEELKSIYGRAKIFILPSVMEGLGFTILEAMSGGCVIISTIPLKFYGKLIKPWTNIDEIVEYIEEIIANKKYTKLGIKNYKLSKEYDWKNYIGKLIKIYEKIL